jgi:SAM-dependent methyltransferase
MIRTVCADLHEWEDGEFDLILASNVLHHVPDPAALFKRLSGWLRPGGLLRVVTYPRQSRIWMRETARWLKINGVRAESPDARRHALHAIALLPEDHPIRSCFISQPETQKPAGLADAFFYPCETPLAPLEWAHACAQTGLIFLGDHQAETSRSSFLSELLPQTKSLSSWERLQILDDLLEVCANPVLWFVKPLNEGPLAYEKNPPLLSTETSPSIPMTESSQIPSRIHYELAQGLRRADRLLSSVGINLSEAIQALRDQVGPRVTPPPGQRELKGLSITEYKIDELLDLPPPPPILDPHIERLQIQDGAIRSWIEPRSRSHT